MCGLSDREPSALLFYIDCDFSLRQEYMYNRLFLSHLPEFVCNRQDNDTGLVPHKTGVRSRYVVLTPKGTDGFDAHGSQEETPEGG